LRSYLDFGVQTAYEAGRLTLGYFGTQAARPEFKSDETPVTVADREAERLIRERIGARYPKHAILGEEYGEAEGSDPDHRWVVDPIDGTKSFVRGVPLFGVLIGLEIEGVCEVGVAYFPAIDEMVCAATGEGCYRNGRRASVSTTRSLAQGMASYTDVASFEEHGRRGESRLVRLLRPRPSRHRQGRVDARPYHGPLGLWPIPSNPPGGRRVLRRLVRQRDHLRHRSDEHHKSPSRRSAEPHRRRLDKAMLEGRG
jgi:histidinol-phosphatase